MANTITLKRRIGSVKNTKQITKAMELVAASKMRRAQDYAVKSRPYRVSAYSMLARLSVVTDVEQHPLYMKRPVKAKLYIVITSNRGLAGAYNSNVLRLLAKEIRADQIAKMEVDVIAIGKQAAQFARRVQGVNLLAAYTDLPDHPTPNDLRPILHTIIQRYTDAQTDDVQLVYTEFKSNLLQVATNLDLLPAQLADADTQEANSEFQNVTFEPSINDVLDNVTERLLEVQLWQALLESNASEHSMRMLAMKNATDNASDLIDDLTLEFNTARQAAITQELAEITGGAEAIK